MMMTKERAAQVWCPMARVGVMASAGGPSAVNDPTVEFRGNCLADGCAMWRWGETKSETQRQVVERRVGFPDRPPEVRKFEEDVRVDVPHRGYCGLAGAPVVRLSP